MTDDDILQSPEFAAQAARISDFVTITNPLITYINDIMGVEGWRRTGLQFPVATLEAVVGHSDRVAPMGVDVLHAAATAAYCTDCARANAASGDADEARREPFAAAVTDLLIAMYYVFRLDWPMAHALAANAQTNVTKYRSLREGHEAEQRERERAHDPFSLTPDASPAKTTKTN